MNEQQPAKDHEGSTFRLAAGAVAAALSFLFGLSASRILFEGLFPQALWLGRPIAALLFGLTFATLGGLLWRLLWFRLTHRDDQSQLTKSDEQSGLFLNRAAWTATAIFLPLTLNLGYLFEQQVNLAASRFLFFASLWLVALFLLRLLARPGIWRWASFLMLIAFLLPIYLATMGQSVGTADTFEFQVVVPNLGIVHPTGYPLYLILSKPFTWLPINSIAWRVNLGTATFGLAAVCLLYLLGWRLTNWSLPALVAAAIFGLSPTFWSQAVEAEVYTLHSLIVVAALSCMREIGDWRLVANIHVAADNRPLSTGRDAPPMTTRLVHDNNETSIPFLHPYTSTLLLAFILGLGLTNHLTTVILFPPALLTIFFAYRAGRYRHSPISTLWSPLLVAIAFLLPLLLYAYLPIRWEAVNGEPMGFSRFIDWVIGGRFQGALQLNAWLDDSTRYNIVGRLFAGEWYTTWTLLLIAVGAANLFLWQWRYGLIVLVTWIGYVFYALNYHVPDLAVFIIPAQLVMAIWWLGGIVAALDLIFSKREVQHSMPVQAIFLLAGIIPLLVIATDQTLPAVNQALDVDRTRWAQTVLDLPLMENAAILADSDKFPPLYYRQQAEGQRPDLDIIVLPDEAAYRAELDSRLAAGQPVFLARYLPGLEGVYHLNSMGPLTWVSTEPQSSLPLGITPSNLSFGSIRLLGYDLILNSLYAEDESAITFYWQASEPVEDMLQVYVRWTGEDFTGTSISQYPANNTYPTAAWKPGEVVADFHTLPRPALDQALDLQVALAPPFARPEELKWQTVIRTALPAVATLSQARPLRMLLGPLALSGATFPNQVRPLDEFLVRLAGHTERQEQLSLALVPMGLATPSGPWHVANPLPSPQPASGLQPLTLWSGQLSAPAPTGQYNLMAADQGRESICGWLGRKKEACVLGQIEISGVPLPAGAINLDDKIALLSIELPESKLQPGGQLPVTLTWQSLGALDEDYTVFVQVLDENDRIVGQVDSWPVQGTYPTSQWRTGEIIEDPYRVQLNGELSSGQYKLNVGLYRLETLRRLPVLDDSGNALDDKVVLPGLTVP